MNSGKSMWSCCAQYAALLAVVSFASPLMAQARTAAVSVEVSRYILKDLGTAGGANSYLADVTDPVNSEGMITIIADTPLSDPFDPSCIYDCFVVHTSLWQDGSLTDLGALSPGVSSLPNGINAAGVIAGFSETGTIDPTFDFPPEFHAVVWKDGQIIDLGTLGGTLSYANSINDRGQVVGFALTGQPDAFITEHSDLDGECGTGDVPSQMRAFVWQEGRGLQDMGTLGGPDSCAKFINQRGQVTGHSFTSYTPNVETGVPTIEPFIWTNGRMIGLGSLGGTRGYASGINNQGQVSGSSNLAGDEVEHAFLWSHGVMRDLTPASDYASDSHALNDKGEVVGEMFDGENWSAFLSAGGVLTNIGACSEAFGINSRTQVVGWATDCVDGPHAFLSERGAPAVDLNTMIPQDSGVSLIKATAITDDGEITAEGVLANGAQHAFLLIPRKDTN